MIVSKQEFARIIAKSQTSVDHYVARGMPGYTPAKTRGDEAQVVLETAIPWLLDYQRDELDEARTRLANEQTAKTALEVRRIRGDLIERSVVAETWGRFVAACRARLLGIPSKIAGRLVAIDDPNVVRDRIEAEIVEALGELSDEGAFVGTPARKSDGEDLGAAPASNGERVGGRESTALT